LLNNRNVHKLKLTRKDFRGSVLNSMRGGDITGPHRFDLSHRAETWRAFSLNSEIPVFPTVTRRGGFRV